MSTEQAPRGRAIEAGQITTIDMEGEQVQYQRAIVIEFDSPEQLREAIKTGRVEFTFLE